MKNIKASLLLLALFFGLGTFAHAQIVECTQENIEGFYLDIPIFENMGIKLEWFIDPFNGHEGGIACFTDSEETCADLYKTGEPRRYDIKTPGRMDIAFNGKGVRSYSCRIIKFPGADRLELRDLNPNEFGGFALEKTSSDVNPISNVSSVPTLSEWGLIAMAGVLGLVGFMVARRRKATV